MRKTEQRKGKKDTKRGEGGARCSGLLSGGKLPELGVKPTKFFPKSAAKVDILHHLGVLVFPFEDFGGGRFVRWVVEVRKVGVCQELRSGQPLLRVEHQHFGEEVLRDGVLHFRHKNVDRFGDSVRKAPEVAKGLLVGQPGHVLLRRFTERITNDAELVEVVLAGEKWLTVHHLREDATSRPDVNCGCVLLAHQQQLWGAVPPRHHVLSHQVVGVEPAGQAEVADPKIAADVRKEVGGFEVAVQHPTRVNVLEPTENLVDEVLVVVCVQLLPGPEHIVHVRVHQRRHNVHIPEVLVPGGEKISDGQQVFVLEEREQPNLPKHPLPVLHLPKHVLTLLDGHLLASLSVHCRTNKPVRPMTDRLRQVEF
eukprot:Hpha_TRINITY_DN15868_c2_g12::TRINITY_DN15868_c2_g12_i1::g.192146::m.192146